jgi:2,3-bisphosphoglycerate-dependent phosphoglycerate mutase
MKSITLIRHGQSDWNKQNRFTGWVDVELSELGKKEAEEAGQILKKHKLIFDLVFTSKLKRAQNTANIVKNVLGLGSLKNVEDYRLNERHYGALQGLDKQETTNKHGAEQVKIWRRSYDTRPPLLSDNEANKFQPPCAGESLKDTVERVTPYFKEHILPELKKGKKILIAAHGNSLRALMKYLYKISDSEIINLEIPTGKPLQCLLDDEYMGKEFSYLE